MTRRLIRLGALTAAVGAALVSTSALAVGPSEEVVQERLHDMRGRFDISVLGGLTMNNKLLDQYVVALQPAYHFTDAWAFELTGGWVFAQEKSNLTGRIRQSVADNNLNDEFADMGSMQWIALGALRWSPIYGKLSLSAVLPIHLGAYISIGGGVLGVNRSSLVDCQNVQDTNGDQLADSWLCAGDDEAADLKPAGSFAFGLRFYASDWFALRTEFKGFMFQDSYTLDIGETAPRPITGLTTALTFLGGASFYF